MARPRVFISSTYYDLKHVRSSLDNFVESLGFDSILSEKGDIAYSPDAPLDESCYREATSADIFVLIIGGRYGSAASSEDKLPSGRFFERYDSITKKEYEAAAARDIPVYILIESNVRLEYQTYLRNKNNQEIQYAHVHSVNIFHLIEEILSKPKNNPVHSFERLADIEHWLREQWAGLFRDLLHRMSSQQQIATLSSQVEALGEINATLQRYLETVVQKVSPDDATQLIEGEQQRLSEIQGQLQRLGASDFFAIVVQGHASVEHFRKALLESDSREEFARQMTELANNPAIGGRIRASFGLDEAMEDLNCARAFVGKDAFPS